LRTQEDIQVRGLFYPELNGARTNRKTGFNSVNLESISWKGLRRNRQDDEEKKHSYFSPSHCEFWLFYKKGDDLARLNEEGLKLDNYIREVAVIERHSIYTHSFKHLKNNWFWFIYYPLNPLNKKKYFVEK